MLQHPSEEHIQGGNAAEGSRKNNKRFAIQAPAKRIELLPRLALAALLGALLLTLSLWLGGLHLPPISASATQPSLSISSGPYRVGSVITLQGKHFSPYAIIVLLVDGQPATDSSGLRLSVNSDAQGDFSATLTITPDWDSGDHIIGAKDTTSGQQVTLDISVADIPAERGTG